MQNMFTEDIVMCGFVRRTVAACIVAVSFACVSASAQQPTGGKVDTPRTFTGVKSWTEWFPFRDQGDCLNGIVDKITDDVITIVLPTTSGQFDPEPRQFLPIEVLAGGKTLKNIRPAYAYLWSDVKRGDSVALHIAVDSASKKSYCLAICILKRPSAKLPPSQFPKEDRYFPSRSILNDIDNGEDVSDEEIAKIFPRRTIPVDFAKPTGPVIVLDSGGLPKEDQAKLDAIRAKKKAKPPEKK